MQFFKQCISLILLIAIGYGIYIIAQNANSGPKDFSVGSDNTTTFTGTVIANITTCFETRATECFLLVKSGKADVFVLYNTSDSGFCLNETAAYAGKTAKINSQVRIYGYYKPKDTTHIVLTCPNNNYYIKPF